MSDFRDVDNLIAVVRYLDIAVVVNMDMMVAMLLVISRYERGLTEFRVIPSRAAVMDFDMMVNLAMVMFLLHDRDMNMLLLVDWHMKFDMMVGVLPVNNWPLNNLFLHPWE